MVPWHLQPKYSGQAQSVTKSSKSDSAKAAAKRAKKAEKLKNKLEKREMNERGSSDSCIQVEEVREGEKCESGDCLLGELLQLCVEEMDEHRLKDQQEVVPSAVKELNHKETETPLQDCSCSAGRGKSTDHDPSPSSADTKGASNMLSDRLRLCDKSEGNGASKASPGTDAELAAQGYRTFQRYYHVFCRGELTKLFSQIEGVRVLEEFYDHENWCVLVERQNVDVRLCNSKTN